MLLVFSGCAPITTSSYQSDTADFGKLKTYAWGRSTLEVDEKGKLVNSASEKVAGMADRSIRPITDSVLSEKGYKLTTDKRPDFVISYVARGRAQSTLPQNVRTLNYDNNEHVKLGTFLMGTLSLVVFDNSQNLVVWRGIGNTPVTGSGENTERLEKVIVKILKDFPDAE